MSRNILDLIGNTPMVELKSLSPNSNVQIYSKLEKFNPGGSVKDRIAKFMIEQAEKSGQLTKKKIIIEPTSGNTGIGLALVARAKGYNAHLVMPETMTMERRQMLIALGARIILSEGTKGMNGAEDLAHELVDKNPGKYFMPNQFSNPANVLAHYVGTGEEIWRDTKGKITSFVAGIGTSGTLMGVSKRLKEQNRDIQIIGVQPEPGTVIQGLKNLQTQYVPAIWKRELVDDIITVNPKDAEEEARRLALQEGVFVGPSSGAILHVALKKASEMGKGIMVVMAPDGGEKYLSTTLCDSNLCVRCAQKYGITCSYMDGTPILQASSRREEMVSP